MESGAERGTEVTRSKTKLIIQTRLPAIDQEVTSYHQPTGDVDFEYGLHGSTNGEISEPERPADEMKYRPSDERCVVVNKETDNNLLPNIRQKSVRCTFKRNAGVIDNVGICARGSVRRSLYPDRALSGHEVQRAGAPPPVYRESSDSAVEASPGVAANPRRAATSFRRVSRKSESTAIKQTYFILQKPGVKLHSSKIPMRRNSAIDASLAAAKLAAPPGVVHSEVNLLTISFRDSDSPTFDEETECTIYGSRQRDIVLRSAGEMRMRSASIPTKSSIAGCVTGTSKVLHSRSESRIT